MQIVKVAETRMECESLKTILFDWSPVEKPKPGQFVMVWIPGVDEVPMSLSCIGIYSEGSGRTGITVQSVGDATRALHDLKPGDKIGVRGPYGNGYRITGMNILFVGGGSGTSSLMPAIETAVKMGKRVSVAVGARSFCDLAFIEHLDGLSVEVHPATDDGTKGHKGFVTDLVETLLAKEKYDQIIACGPEPMLFRLLVLANRKKMPIQCSLERYMKCGIGICGSCDINGRQVCREGPVFDGKVLKELGEFGKTKRDKSGRKQDF